MGRYPFITGVTEFLKKDGDYYEDITRKSHDRKLRFFGKIFEDLKKEGKVSSTNPKSITEDDIYAFVGHTCQRRHQTRHDTSRSVDA